MKILVTGSTGFIGASLVRELIADGRDVRVLVRPNADLSNIDGLKVEVVHGDLRNCASLDAALKGCDVLYHRGVLQFVEPRQANDVRHQRAGYP